MKTSVKRISLTVLFTVILLLNAKAQCFEIESILVDACGSPEGANEMVRFKVGTADLNTGNMSVSWPNTSNPWRGICQNTNTTSKVAAFNASILGCGILIEPTAGTLPAGSTVMLFTSEDVDVSANSFTNLNDTLYAIFQCTGNTNGHFANWNTAPGLRTLTISFSSPLGCNDTVTYDRTLLVNQNGTIGGLAAIRDGALANFDSSGNVSYENFGCQAPFVPAGISAAVLPSSSLQICPGDSINLFGTLTGSFDSLRWSGGLGSYGNPANDTTTYYSSTSEIDSFYIRIKGFNACASGSSDSVLVYFTDSSDVSILGGSTANLCSGANLNITASGASSYLWNTNETTTTINTTTGGQFFVTDTTNKCFPDTAFMQVNIVNPSVVTISENDTSICQGQSLTLHANGASSYIWQNGSNLSSINVNTSGFYYVYSNLPCPSDTDSVLVTVVEPTNVSITASSPAILCEGNSLTISATPSSTNYTWNTNDTTNTITINSPGLYTVNFHDGICPNTMASITVESLPNPTASIIGNSTFCVGESSFLDASGIGNFSWSNGDIGNSTIITSSQEITLTASNTCGSDTDTIIINEIDCSENDSIFIPNVFTPNNDNFNDLFKIEGKGILSFSGQIFNRWGTLLFEWNDIHDGWNGANHSEGTYFYLIKTTFRNDGSKTFRGSVSLLK